VWFNKLHCPLAGESGIIKRKMKKIIFLFLLLSLAITVSAQIKISDQPGDAYYETVKKTCMGKMPAKTTIATMKGGSPVSASILDTLKKYDWYLVGSYGFREKESEDYFAQELFANEKESQYQFRSFRILPDGMRADFSLNRFKTNPSDITTTSFTKANASVFQSIKVMKAQTFIQCVIFGSSEYLKIVSYKDGLLVIDISINGKVTDPPRFRNVYYAVPQKFQWAYTQ
jgi:hypothetical protein